MAEAAGSMLAGGKVAVSGALDVATGDGSATISSVALVVAGAQALRPTRLNRIRP